jgi:hypothetical protein
MVSQAPTWSLFYKNLGSNLEVNLKIQTIMDFNLHQVSTILRPHARSGIVAL